MFTFDLDYQALFDERAWQLKAQGISRRSLRQVRSHVTNFWGTGPGAWTHEWTLHAKQAERAERWLEASACHGAARFPVINTPERKQALADQIRCYLRAAPEFPCRFERKSLDIRTAAGPSQIMAHLFEPAAPARRPRPLLCLSGGVYIGKFELHQLAVALARYGGLRVCALDMPGTGETTLPLEPDSQEVYRQVIDQLRDPSARTGMLGISIGGHWAAKLAMQGAVDAAVDIGGPVGFDTQPGSSPLTLNNALTGTIANAMQLSAMPDEAQANQLTQEFSLAHQGLLIAPPKAKLLVINGRNDPYVGLQDTQGFAGLANAEVWLIEHAGHCAAEQFVRLVPGILLWLRRHLGVSGSLPYPAGLISRLVMPRRTVLA
ncbi:MAG: alpha/beta fold hydrolase [Paludibacterium sp.]|uniref:alpha/beta fold hydrolase n=1 Tax=Paludibacterium sp. TaxID=1917523 RepID=UPI0025EDFDEF|nr:alpha/beta fold hydrolase [Paludibacterium sp.]MBV8048491.1 alpha/beta fold hydrolase [Paludibacterium sp.]MBV8647351.1 alpha/beta fold hydrolase [Paludibacterium sp.]